MTRLIEKRGNWAFARYGKVFLTQDIKSSPFKELLNDESAEHKENGATEEPLSVAQSATTVVDFVFSEDASYLIVVYDNKLLQVWSVKDFKLQSKNFIPRKALAIDCAIYNKKEYVVVGDKVGEVTIYPLLDVASPGFKSLLQHTSSIVTDLIVSPGSKYVISADRDEKIRVSLFPRTVITQSFCLAHTEFVGKLAMSSKYPGMLLSFGGDAKICLWKFESGELLDTIQLPSTESCTPTVLKVCDITGTVVAAMDECNTVFTAEISSENDKTSLVLSDPITLCSTPLSVTSFEQREGQQLIVSMQSSPYIQSFEITQGKMNPSSNAAYFDDLCKLASGLTSSNSTRENTMAADEDQHDGQLRKKRIKTQDDWKDKRFPAVRYVDSSK